MLREKIEKAVFELCEPVTLSYGLELVLVQYRREDHGWVLRILVDRAGGVSVDECGTLSREISDLLDVEDLIDTAYNLEVSSPGLDRPLREKRDFTKVLGEEINLYTKESIEGKDFFNATLDSADDEYITLKTRDGRMLKISYDNIHKAKLEIKI